MALSVGVDVLENLLVVAFYRDGGFVPPAEFITTAENLCDRISAIRRDAEEQVLVSIDAPRCYLTSPRKWRLHERGGRWVSNPNEKGYGRHSDVLIRFLELANPIWTPVASDPQPWITFGQEVFAMCAAAGFTAIECFPSASYRCLGQMSGHTLAIPGEMFRTVQRDYYKFIPHIFDACVAAYTAELYRSGSATELGGGDGYGAIVVPGCVKDYIPDYTPEKCPPFPTSPVVESANGASLPRAENTPDSPGGDRASDHLPDAATVPDERATTGEEAEAVETIDSAAPAPDLPLPATGHEGIAPGAQIQPVVQNPASSATPTCPQCRRRIAANAGKRYCMVCDLEF